VEVVSRPNPGHVLPDYARMGIPRCLIIDPRERMWSYHWDIDTSGANAAYVNRLGKRPFGEVVAIATEFGEWTIETAGLPPYTPTYMAMAEFAQLALSERTGLSVLSLDTALTSEDVRVLDDDDEEP
jgi:hypothetical protein